MPAREVLKTILKTSARIIIELGYFILYIPRKIFSLVTAKSPRSAVSKKTPPKSKALKVKEKHRKRKIIKRILVCKPLIFIYGIIFALVFLVVPILLMNWFRELP
ncbi:MAG: hypothetical protein WC243_04800, partial [Patescibacteria group bacterium]